MNCITDPNNPSMVLRAGDYPVHRAANIVPLDANFKTLEDSILRSGLIDPITLYKGNIIDGRRRAIVCKGLNIPVREDEISIEGDKTDREIYELVLAKNQRRSLSKAQLAMIAAFEVEKGSNKLIGIPRATIYARNIWDVSKVTYEKARYIYKNNIRMAHDIFATGFTEINGQRTTMAAAHEYLKVMEISRMDNMSPGNADTAIFAEAFDDFLKNQKKHLSVPNIRLVLERKLRELK